MPPKLAANQPNWRLFLLARKEHTLPMKNKSQHKLGPQTQAIHGGEPNPRGVNGPIVTEIIRSFTFTFSSTEEMKLLAEGKNKAYLYTRYRNPTLTFAQKNNAAPE